MKELHRFKRTAANAWGKIETVEWVECEVETSDVGQARNNYLGTNHRHYTFLASDVGRRIETRETPGWPCWNFNVKQT